MTDKDYRKKLHNALFKECRILCNWEDATLFFPEKVLNKKARSKIVGISSDGEEFFDSCPKDILDKSKSSEELKENIKEMHKKKKGDILNQIEDLNFFETYMKDI